MGCCMSSSSTKGNHKLESDVKCRSPPPPPPPVTDEETVKEVLSETSIYKPPDKTASETVAVATNYRSNNVQRRDIFAEDLEKVERIGLIRPTEEAIANISEISRDSEICSFSGSCSTTTLNDRDEGEVTQRVILCSPAKIPKKPSYYGEMYNNRRLRSPSTSSVASPVMMTSHVRSRPSEERMMMIPRRNVGPINEIRGSPARRLISPVPCGEVVKSRNVGQKHPASSRTGNPHWLLQARRGDGGGKLGKEKKDVIEDSIETFENPHISLECFIFL